MTICTTRQGYTALSFVGMVLFLAILTACSPARLQRTTTMICH